MDLSLGLSAAQQEALFVGVVLVLTGLVALWAWFTYSRFETKANWTAHLKRMKYKHEVKWR